MLPLRYHFLNLSRYGSYCEKAIREQLTTKLPFASLFAKLYSPLKKKECLLAFDPTFIAKAGKKTVGLGWFWNSTYQRVEKGLEACLMAMIDVEDRAAYHFDEIQTALPAEQDKESEKRPMEQCVKMITGQKETILQYTSVVVADGYFMKKSFIKALTNEDFQIVT